MQQLVEERRDPTVAKPLAEEDMYKLTEQTPVSEKNDVAMVEEKFKARNINAEELTRTVNENVNSISLEDITGTKAMVSKYSLNRYSFDEWRKRNKIILDASTVTESNIVEYNGQTAIMAAIGKVDKVQRSNRRMLKQKAKEIFRWKVEAEAACKAMTNEVELLEIEKQRLKKAYRTLILPESIIKECMEIRSNRTETELVADAPEQGLLKELELVKKIRQTINSLIQKLDEQLAIDKAAKQRIEYDWCDKSDAYNTDSENLSLNANSSTIMFKHGAVKYNNFTAPLEYYDFYCRENIENIEAVRQVSSDFRSYLNTVLINNGKKLRQEADVTDKILATAVSLTTELLTQLAERLKHTLQSLADTEKLIQNLQETIIKMDRAMKLAQTRLDNCNNWRPHGENVRDEPHLGLLQEVKIIHETVTSLLMELKKAENNRETLIEKRLEIERDIASKKKTLNIDRLRCGMIRSHYPTTSQLAGL